VYIILDVNGVSLFDEEFASFDSAMEFALWTLPETVDFQIECLTDTGTVQANSELPDATVISLCDYRKGRSNVKAG
jgi:hypothetical protein